jgi:hypothetical protein
MTFGETVVRVRRGAQTGVDRYGHPVYGDDVDTDLTGAAFDPGGSLEPVEVGRTPVITTPKLYFRTEPDLVSTDRVRVRGLLYVVEGHPAVWVSPFTSVTRGTVVELKRVDG